MKDDDIMIHVVENESKSKDDESRNGQRTVKCNVYAVNTPEPDSPIVPSLSGSFPTPLESGCYRNRTYGYLGNLGSDEGLSET